MRALVVYESIFGNTASIAEAIGEGLSSRLPTEVVEVGSAPTALDEGISLLVVGGPTHAFGMSRASTRADAARKSGGTMVAAELGQREWLERLSPNGTCGAAAFDTRVAKPRMPGSAAHAAQRRLRRHGLPIVAEAESFWVDGTPGPLLAGEVERARTWGALIGDTLTAVRA